MSDPYNYKHPGSGALIVYKQGTYALFRTWLVQNPGHGTNVMDLFFLSVQIKGSSVLSGNRTHAFVIAGLVF